MTISLRGRMLALTFLVALVAAACGGNGNDAGGSGGATTTGASTSSGSTGSSDGAGRYGGDGDDTGATGETGDDHGMGSDEGEAEDGPTVQANNFAFDPTEASVESGEDLYLKNGNANTPHTFTVEGTDIDVELAPLATDEVKVDLDPGTYEFHCRFHAEMTGTLTVT